MSDAKTFWQSLVFWHLGFVGPRLIASSDVVAKTSSPPVDVTRSHNRSHDGRKETFQYPGRGVAGKEYDTTDTIQSD